MITTHNAPLRSSLMTVLWDIQSKRRHIPQDDMVKIAKEFRMSRMELEGVLSFYHFFHTEHAGKYTIYLNNSAVAQHRGLPAVRKTFEEELGIRMGQVTPDKRFGLFQTSCIGLSDQEPSALINFFPFTELDPDKVRLIIRQLRNGVQASSIADVPRQNIRYTPDKERTLFFKDYNPGSSLEAIRGKDPEDVIRLVKDSRISGRGGAFFPTGLKWEICRKQADEQKFIICNADEGEPGTFKDRVLLQAYPGLLLEGMAIAGYAVGADKGYIYLRAEYFYLKHSIEQTIREFKEQHLLGRNILGLPNFNFDVYVYMGAGAYVCGEETALIASMEGKRGEPSTKEFFPVEKGFLGKPTLVNNVETLCAVSRILETGVEAFLRTGTQSTPGTKLISVSGDCENPGIYEIEWGMKLKDLLRLCGANDPYLILFNGYAGECLSEADFERELSGENLLEEHIQFQFEDPMIYARKMGGAGLRSGGSFMIFNRQRDLMKLFKSISDFFVEESCGICAPCRTGNFLLNKRLQKVQVCHAGEKDLDELRQWAVMIKSSSRCGLGKTSVNCMLTGMLKFPQEFHKCLLAESDVNKSFQLEQVTSEYENIIHEIESIQ